MTTRYRTAVTRRSAASTLGLLATIGLGGCQLIAAGDCTTIAIPAISVDVVDSVTGAPAGGVVVYARDGAFADSVTVPAPQPGFSFPGSLAYERAGTYDVTVQGTGYREWRRTGVSVRKSTCHVETARLVARLVRSP